MFHVLESINKLAVLRTMQKCYIKVENLYKVVLKARRYKLSDIHAHTLESLNNLIKLYEAWGKPEKPDEWRTKLPQAEALEEL